MGQAQEGVSVGLQRQAVIAEKHVVSAELCVCPRSPGKGHQGPGVQGLYLAWRWSKPGCLPPRRSYWKFVLGYSLSPEVLVEDIIITLIIIIITIVMILITNIY